MIEARIRKRGEKEPDTYTFNNLSELTDFLAQGDYILMFYKHIL